VEDGCEVSRIEILIRGEIDTEKRAQRGNTTEWRREREDEGEGEGEGEGAGAVGRTHGTVPYL
jgi:hypothetical protein